MSKPDKPLSWQIRNDGFDFVDASADDILTDEEKTWPLVTDPKVRIDAFDRVDASSEDDVLTEEEKSWPLARPSV